MKSHFASLKPKTVYYRNFKNFDETSFLNDLRETNFDLSTNDPNENHSFITDTFIKIVQSNAPLKKRFVRGNEAPFMIKELRKAIYTRSRLRNNFCKNPTKENEKKYKIQRNKCMSIRKKSLEKYFNNISNDGVFFSILNIYMTCKHKIHNHQSARIWLRITKKTIVKKQNYKYN